MLIKIDRSTVRRNPHAGCTEFLIPGRESFSGELIFSGPKSSLDGVLPDVERLVESGECLLQEWGVEDLHLFRGHQLGTVHFSGASTERIGDVLKSSVDKLGDRKGVFVHKADVKVDRPVQRYRTMYPEPAFLFEREDPEVECDSCHSRFLYSELQSDSVDDAWSNEICPICGEWECCEVEPEELTPEMTQHL